MIDKNLEQKLAKQNLIVKALENGSDQEIISLLIDLKEQGDLFYLTPLLNLITSNRSELLKKSLLEFISDIKIQEATQIISNYISSNIDSPNLIKIITASWQSRLDFSKVLSPYFEILIKGDYKISFEAFTVIENSLDSLSIDELTSYIELVKKGVVKADRDKQLLLLEMVSVIDKVRRAVK